MDKKYIEKVEGYFSGHMNEAEMRRFEEELVNDESLAEVYQEYLVSMEMIDAIEERNLYQKFSEWEHKEAPVKHIDKKQRSHIWYYVAATIALVVGLYYVFINQKITSIGNDQLAVQYYSKPESPGSTMGSGDEQWSNGVKYYEEKKYSLAIQSWNAIETPTAEVQYFLAHAYFMEKDFSKAASLFENLSMGSSAYSYASEWYLVLTYLSNNDPSNFNQTLHKILNDQDHPYFHDALELSKSTIHWQEQSK